MNKLIPGLMMCAVLACASTAAAQATFEDKPLGYVRLDTNLRSTQVWLGGSLPLSGTRSMDLSGDLILDGTRLQGDLGVTFYAGALAVLPMLGISFDFDEDRMEFDTLVIPRVFTVAEFGPLYFESWLEIDLRHQFLEGALDEFYTREFLLFVAHEHFAFGPQWEMRYALKNGPPDNHVYSMPFGGQIATAWGAAKLSLFLGYETVKFSRGGGSGVVGRFTFTHAWQ